MFAIQNSCSVESSNLQFCRLHISPLVDPIRSYDIYEGNDPITKALRRADEHCYTSPTMTVLYETHRDVRWCLALGCSEYSAEFFNTNTRTYLQGQDQSCKTETTFCSSETSLVIRPKSQTSSTRMDKLQSVGDAY